MKPIKLYKITPEVAEYYRLNVKGNEDVADDTIAKKLTRNIIMSKRLLDDHGKHTYLYGQLYILIEPVNRTIVEIGNYTMNTPKFTKNVRWKNRLNEALGIC